MVNENDLEEILSQDYLWTSPLPRYNHGRCRKRMRIYFIKMQELKDRFRSSIISGSTGRLLSGFLKYQCIIIDEVCISFSGESYRGRGRTSISLDFANPIIRMGN